MECLNHKDKSIMYCPSYIKIGTAFAVMSDGSIPALSNDNNSHCIIEGEKEAECAFFGDVSGSFAFDGAFYVTVECDVDGDVELCGAKLSIYDGDFTGYCSLTPGSRLSVYGSIDISSVSATKGTIVHEERDFGHHFRVME